MAKRSREQRQTIPGYDESRPTRQERKKLHRATRHAAHQMLHSIEDPDDIVLPEQPRTRKNETSNGRAEPTRRRFRVWKTKFWKRRDSFKEEMAELNSDWPVITPNQLEQE